MNITIYTGFSKPANSTKQPTGGTDISCTLKGNVSVIDPIFIIDRTDSSINYVRWGNRYYFVTNVIYVRATTIELHCHVDALATYKSQIGASTQYVTRASSMYRDSIIDSLYPCTTHNYVSRVEFSSLHNQVVNGATYVLGVLGGGASSVDGVKYYALSATDFATLTDYLSSGNFLDAPVTEISKALQKELVNPFQYFTSCTYFPFEINSIQTSQALTFGYYTYDSFVVPYINPNEASETYAYFTDTFTIPNHPQAYTAYSYLRNSPYTKLLLHCYGFGDIPMDASLFNTNNAYTGRIKIYVDFFSGVALLLIENDAGIVVYRSHAQFGVPVQLSQSQSPNLLRSALGVVSTLGAVASGNFIGSLSGVGDALNGLLPQVEKSGAYATRSQFTEIPSLTITQTQVSEKDMTKNGAPFMQSVTINTLSGYIKVENPEIDIVGTVQEKDEISSYMADGFFYE